MLARPEVPMRATYIGDCADGVEGPAGAVVKPGESCDWLDDAQLNPAVWRVDKPKPPKAEKDGDA